MSEKNIMKSTEENNETKQPTATFRAGNLTVTQWDNTISKTDGSTFELSNYTIRRGYQDKEGDWHSTDQLQHGDLLKVSELLREAHRNKYKEV